MTRDSRSSNFKSNQSPAKRRKRANRKLLLESLENRELLATLTSGSGEGHLTVLVNEYGAFGRSAMLEVSQPFNPTGPREIGDAVYDPIGPITGAGTVYESLMLIKVGSDPVRAISDGPGGVTTANLPAFENGRFAGAVDPLTQTINSVFYYPETALADGTNATLRINLRQTLLPIAGPGTAPVGVTLRQTYTITNLTNSAIDFELWRYLDGDMLFDGSFLNDGAGMRQVVQNDPERVFMTNTATNTNRNDPTFLEVRSDPSGLPEPRVDRWEVGLSRRAVNTTTAPCTVANPCKHLPFLGPNAPLIAKIINDQPLANDIVRPVQADIDGNNKVDNGAGDDWAIALRNTYSASNQFPNALPAQGTIVYVAETQWGNPEIGDPEPPIVPAPNLGTVAGFKFSDANGNGVRDPGELNVGGFRIYSDTNNNNVFDPGEPTAVTDASGFYQFTVPVGTHNIREVPQANWTQTFPASGFHNVTIANVGEIVSGLNFGNQAAPGSVSGTVFDDFNRNGRFDPGEFGLGTAFVYADLNNNSVFDANEPSATSDVSGAYTLSNLDPRTYVIRQVPPAGYDQTFPSNNGAQVVGVSPGQNIGGINFGDAIRPGSINGQVFVDTNNNGVIDPGETGASGIIVYVDADNNCNIGLGENAIVTGPSGTFGLNGVRPGTYTVRMALPAGFEQVEPMVPGSGGCAPGIVVTVAPGTATPNVNFLVSNPGGSGPDFGDAPAPYPTTLAQNGARHTIQKGFGLGALRDGELNGQPSANADADDNNGLPDEDGIVFLGPNGLPQTSNLVGRGKTVFVQVTVSTGGFFPGKLQGFIDFNDDGDWNDPGEKVIADMTLPAGVHNIPVTIPSNAAIGTTYARFRYGYEHGLGPTGASIAGEVEDYAIFIVGPNPIANDDSYELLSTSGEVTLDVLANDFPSENGDIFINPDGIDPTSVNGTLEVAADGKSLLYTPDPFTPFETFTYTITDPAGNTATATVTINVRIAPIAVDDAFLNVPQGVSGFFLDVLANDFAGAGTLIVTDPLTPVLSQGGTLTIAPNGTGVLYTPPSPVFAGTETFQYTVLNGSGLTATGNITIQVTPGNTANDLVEFDLELLQLDGTTPLDSEIGPGQLFLLRVTSDDLRTDPILNLDGMDVRGVAAAFLDVLYDRTRLEVVADQTIVGWNVVFGYNIQFNSLYSNTRSGSNAVEGILNEAGGTIAFGGSGSTTISPDPVEVFTVTMRARATAPNGIATLYTDPADVSPDHDVLIFGADGGVPVIGPNQITLNQTSVTIDSSVPVNNGVAPPAPEPNDPVGGGIPAFIAHHRNANNPFDVNADGKLTPVDALLVVNSLNILGARSVADAPVPNASNLAFMDVNGDNVVNSLDALLVIARMNASSATAQGEGEPVVATSTSPATISLAPGETVEVSVPPQFVDAEETSPAPSLASEDITFADFDATLDSLASEDQFLPPSSTNFSSWGGTAEEDEEFDDLLLELAENSCHPWQD